MAVFLPLFDFERGGKDVGEEAEAWVWDLLSLCRDDYGFMGCLSTKQTAGELYVAQPLPCVEYKTVIPFAKTTINRTHFSHYLSFNRK